MSSALSTHFYNTPKISELMAISARLISSTVKGVDSKGGYTDPSVFLDVCQVTK